MNDDLPGFLEEIPFDAWETEELGKLTNGDHQCQSEDETREDRLGEEIFDEAQASDAKQQHYHANGDGQASHQGSILVRVATRQHGHSSCQHDGAGGGGSHHQLARTAEKRVAEQEERRRKESCLWG